MDMEEIRYLLGGTVFARAKAYTDRIQDLNCEVAGNGVRHLSADVRGGGRSLYQTQVWLRENGSFVSASCSCPYNENGEGPCCKHIGALLMWDSESQGLSGRAPQKPSESPESIPGVVRGTANLQTPQPEEPPRRDSYASSLEMLFGKKWRGEEPESDYEARRLLRAYQEGALAEVDGVTGHAELRPHAAELEPELTLLPGELPWLRLRISADGGRQYVVKSIPDLLRAVEKHGFISYGKALEFQHSWEAFAPEAQQLLRLLRRQLSAKEGAEAALRSYGNAPRSGPAGGIPLNGEIFDGLVALYAPTGNLGGYTLKTGIPALTMRVEKRRGGVEVSVTPALGWKTGLDNDYLYSEDTIWQLDRAESARMRPALEALCGKSLFFTTGDATAFCSYVLPELGSRVTIEDPERLLLNQIPLEPVVQFYLDAPTRETVRAHLEFLYGEDGVTPEEPGPAGLLRDARAEQRAGRLLGRYLEPGPDTMGNGLAAHYDAYEEDEVYRFLDEGIPALLAEGEVYLTDAFRSMQAEDLGGGVGARQRARPGGGHGGVPGGGAESPAEIAPPEKALPPPARWPSAPAGRFHGGAGRAERDAGAFRGQTGPGPCPAAPVPGPQSGLGAFGAERHPLQPGRCLPSAQPELPRGKGQRVYTACIFTKSFAKIPAGRLPLAPHAGWLRHGRHPCG